MSTNIFFPADRLEELTASLKEYDDRNDIFKKNSTVRDMLNQLGVETYINRDTGDLVVDRLGDYSDLYLVACQGIKAITDFVQSADGEAPFMEFSNEDGEPMFKLILQPGGTWKFYKPVMSWQAAGSI